MKKTALTSALLAALSVQHAAVIAADNTCHGYGQGTAVDEKNRPCGAVSFTEQYSGMGAFALTPDENRIILTFDQGYENGFTSKILDTLKEKNVQAIFFLTGDYARKEPELIKRMINEGHILGNHSMTHPSMPSLSQDGVRKEIMSLHDYVLNNYGYEMQYFRPPCGEYSEQTLDITQRCGYRTILWSYAYVDWKQDSQPAPAASLEKLTSSAHGGEILLLHSVSATNAEILGSLIDALRAKGYKV